VRLLPSPCSASTQWGHCQTGTALQLPDPRTPDHPCASHHITAQHVSIRGECCQAGTAVRYTRDDPCMPHHSTARHSTARHSTACVSVAGFRVSTARQEQPRHLKTLRHETTPARHITAHHATSHISGCCVITKGTLPDRNSRAAARPSDTRPPLLQHSTAQHRAFQARLAPT
jgi:hypothetical protein